MRDLVAFAERFNPEDGDALDQLAQFADSVMVNVGASDFVARVKALDSDRRGEPVVDAVHVALDFVQQPNYLTAVDLLVEIGKLDGVRTHRPAVLRACIKALQLCHGTDGLSLYEAAIRMREENRLVGRPLPRRAVGSTLLLKGLEGDVAVILNAEALNSSNLYVAMTRGSKRLIVCSSSPILKPN